MDWEEWRYGMFLKEQTEDYEEMVGWVRKGVWRKDGDLSPEERNYLSLAYKRTLIPLRTSCRSLTSLLLTTPSDSPFHSLTVLYFHRIQTQVRTLCSEVLELLEKKLLIAADNSESRVCYLLMKADYLRYTCEISTETERDLAESEALAAYEAAMAVASTELHITHPSRLEVALHFSCFHYTILHQPTTAQRLIQSTYDSALLHIHQIPPVHFKDSIMLFGLLRDSTTLQSLWF